MHLVMWGFWAAILGLLIVAVVQLARRTTESQDVDEPRTQPASGSADLPTERGKAQLGPEELALLDEDERILYKLVASDDDIYQKDLPELTGFSKAKVSRLLDKLERKDLVQRLSHGMTNRVVLAPATRS